MDKVVLCGESVGGRQGRDVGKLSKEVVKELNAVYVGGGQGGGTADEGEVDGGCGECCASLVEEALDHAIQGVRSP